MSAALNSLMQDIPARDDQPDALGGLTAFAIIGSAGALAFVLLTTIVTALTPEVEAWWVNAACYGALIVPVYLLHRRFSFRSDASHSRALPRYVAVQMMALVLAAAITFIIHVVLTLPTIIASTVVIGLTSVVNFVVLRAWAFARAHMSETATA